MSKCVARLEGSLRIFLAHAMCWLYLQLREPVRTKENLSMQWWIEKKENAGKSLLAAFPCPPRHPKDSDGQSWHPAIAKHQAIGAESLHSGVTSRDTEKSKGQFRE